MTRFMIMHNNVFLLPGLYNSGPAHWQTHWENKYGFQRIIQRDWETPDREEWVETVRQHISPGPAVLIAHSLACCTVAHLAAAAPHLIKAALLVAPSDVEAANYPTGTTGFSPMPLIKLPFPSVVIASTNDEYVSYERAAYFAESWGSESVSAGDCGHINSTSDLGDWPEGYEHLITLINSTAHAHTT